MNPTIEKRVRKIPVRNGQRSFSTGGTCLICGKAFKSDQCPHNVRDNELAVQAVYAKDLLS